LASLISVESYNRYRLQPSLFKTGYQAVFSFTKFYTITAKLSELSWPVKRRQKASE